MKPVLLIQKRVEFSASKKLATSTNPAGEGHNYVAFFAFKGPIDPKTGMILELSIVKERLQSAVLNVFDHHHLNETVFQKTEPTLESIALALLNRAKAAFTDLPATPVRCTVVESESHVVQVDTIFQDEPIFQNVESLNDLYQMNTVSFNAIHRLCNTTWSAQENENAFGKCARFHGHQFKVMISSRQRGDDSILDRLQTACAPFHDTVLNDLGVFKEQPCTSEYLLLALAKELQDVAWVELALQETPNNLFLLCRPS